MGANVFQTTTVSREKAEKSMRMYHLGGDSSSRFCGGWMWTMHMDFHRGTSHKNGEKKLLINQHYWRNPRDKMGFYDTKQEYAGSIHLILAASWGLDLLHPSSRTGTMMLLRPLLETLTSWHNSVVCSTLRNWHGLIPLCEKHSIKLRFLCVSLWAQSQ